MPGKRLDEIIGELKPGRFYNIPTSTLPTLPDKEITGYLVSYDFAPDFPEGEVVLKTQEGLVSLVVSPDTIFIKVHKKQKPFYPGARYGDNYLGKGKVIAYDHSGKTMKLFNGAEIKEISFS